jgi:hypothetical protein
MTREQMQPGTKIKYHGGWNGASENRCEICKFQCGYIWAGVIIERYTVWDSNSQRSIPHPHLWTALLETGSYAVGSLEQFELDVTA